MGLYAIAQALEAKLKAKHVPIPVSYVLGAEPTGSTTSARERIVIIEPRGEKGSRIVAPRGIHVNPRQPVRSVDPGTIRIYARSAVAGARDNEHVDRAHRIRGHVLGLLETVARERKNVIEWGGGGFINLPDTTGTVFSGAIYEHDFTLDSSIELRTWEGDENPEATVGSNGLRIRSTTKASDEPGEAGTPPVDAETAC